VIHLVHRRHIVEKACQKCIKQRVAKDNGGPFGEASGGSSGNVPVSWICAITSSWPAKFSINSGSGRVENPYIKMASETTNPATGPAIPISNNFLVWLILSSIFITAPSVPMPIGYGNKIGQGYFYLVIYGCKIVAEFMGSQKSQQ
jgi:hypothetical protein